MTGIRVCAGQFRGRLIPSPDLPGTRPLLGRVRKSLGDVLHPWIQGTGVLDLFAGTGAVGIELLSRGARAVTFVESSPRAARAIETTLAGFGAEPRIYRAVVGDVLQPSEWWAATLPGAPFGVVFVGTPYRMLESADGEDRLRSAVAGLATLGAVAGGGRAVVQAEGPAAGRLAEQPPAGFMPDDPPIRKYGRTALVFWRLA